MLIINSLSSVVPPVPMGTVTDGLIATTGIVVNDLLLTNTTSVASSMPPGLVMPTDLSVGATASLAASGLVDVPMMVPQSSVGGALVPSSVTTEVKTVNGVNQQPQQQPPASIPQEIATMSDHDLISYINPNCFEQGEFLGC